MKHVIKELATGQYVHLELGFVAKSEDATEFYDLRTAERKATEISFESKYEFVAVAA